MGAETGTTQRLNVVSVDPESNVMLIEGSVPGPNGGCVSVYKTTRPRRAPKISAVSKKSVKAAVKSAKAPAKPAK